MIGLEKFIVLAKRAARSSCCICMVAAMSSVFSVGGLIPPYAALHCKENQSVRDMIGGLFRKRKNYVSTNVDLRKDGSTERNRSGGGTTLAMVEYLGEHFTWARLVLK